MTDKSSDSGWDRHSEENKLSNERSKNYFRQVKGGIVYRIGAMVASYLSIPVMLNALGQEQYGIWSTLLSIMSWLVFFDLGIGNGLRNKVSESIAKGSYKNATDYIASAYTIIGIIAASVLVCVLAGSFFVPWGEIFNTVTVADNTLRVAFQIAAIFVLVNFWLGLINPLFGALQITALTNAGQMITNILVLASVGILSQTMNLSISIMAIIYGLALTLSNAMLSTWAFSKHVYLRPRIFINKDHLQPLLSVGLKFFTIQIAGLIIFTTDKMLITQLFGPQQVALYDVVFKLFSIISIAYAVISAPLWSSYTDAYHRGDIAWIKKSLWRQLYIYFIVAISILVMTPLARSIIKVWVGYEFPASTPLIYSMGIYVLITNWTSIFSCLLNGVGKIQLSWVLAIIAMFLNIPIGMLLAKYTQLGISSIVIGTICTLIPPAILGPYQVLQIISKRDAGIWAR